MNFRILDTKSKNYCILRNYFDSVYKDSKKVLSLNEITEVPDKEQRPEYTSIIRVRKSNSTDKKSCFFMGESIYTNEDFLGRFKNFLRASSEEIEAENYEYVPKEYIKDWYKISSLTLIPTEEHHIGSVLREPGKLPKLSIDFVVEKLDPERNCTLKMIKAKTMDEKLKEIEEKSNFSAFIGYFKNSRDYLKSIEVKHGLIHFANSKI